MRDNRLLQDLKAVLKEILSYFPKSSSLRVYNVIVIWIKFVLMTLFDEHFK